MRPHVHRARLLGVLLAGCLCAQPAEAEADWLFTPFIGTTFGGDTVIPDLEEGATTAKLVFGGSVGWLGSGIFGLEADFAYVPHFFETSNEFFSNSNVTTLGGALIVAVPEGVTRESLRPFLVAGVNLMHIGLGETFELFPELFDFSRNSMGMQLGGGVIGYFTDTTGVRFEVRHLRSLERDTNLFTGERGSLLSFWRFTAGVVIRP